MTLRKKITKEITVKEFSSDIEADEFWEKYEIPKKYKGLRVIGCELQYACLANNWKKTRIVIFI